MLRPWQCSLAQLLGGLLAFQVLCAAAAGAFGELIRLLTLAIITLSLAAAARLIGEGLAEIAVDVLAAIAECLPLETRWPAQSLRRLRPF